MPVAPIGALLTAYADVPLAVEALKRGARVFITKPWDTWREPGRIRRQLPQLVERGGRALRVRVHQGTVRARVAAGCAGLARAEALIAHIFTPFFSTKKQGGGIGLAMVRHLIHGNGGTVRYAKSVSAGARFVITF